MVNPDVTPTPPFEGQWLYNWPVILSTALSYVLTFFFFTLIDRSVGASYQFTLLGFGFLVSAAPLILTSFWLIALARGFKRHLTILQGVAMGVLADLLVLRGLQLLYRPEVGQPIIEFLLLLTVATSLILLAVTGNLESLRRGRAEQRERETDELTGLLNRRGIRRRYHDLAAHSAVVVAMLDLNDLKAINDLNGHSAGDHHLKAVARALQSHLPHEAILGRWGGDEFVIVVPEQFNVASLVKAVRAEVPHPDPALVSFALGTTSVQAHVSLERALALADQQMYADKRSTYATRNRRGADQVSLANFPHFLLGLSAQQEILEQGVGRAAELADFEGWFYARTGEAIHLTHREHANAPIQHMVVPRHLQDRGILGDVLRYGEVIWAPDYENSRYMQPFWVQLGLKSIAVAPVSVGGTVVAAVGFTSHQTWRSTRPQAEQLLEAVATRLGQQQQEYRNLELVQASVEAGITGMGVIMEARDLETAGHTVRVVELALQLGEVVGLDAEQMQALRLGAYLHDVGKLAIPDRVLLKPGALDQEEWALMQTHSEMGARMALRLPSLPLASVEVVRSHHERWDGSGYPQGLCGESIPLLARIFALCDVYDALINVRPYKQAWTTEAAKAELASQVGRHFDPRLTQLFIEQVLQNRAEVIAVS